MVAIAFFAMAAACVFFLYVLVQFWLEEKHPRRSSDTPMAFPIVSSGQIVMARETPREQRRRDSAIQKTQGEHKNRR
jgi:hypothetical protein